MSKNAQKCQVITARNYRMFIFALEPIAGFQCHAIQNRSKLVVIKDYESAFDAV